MDYTNYGMATTTATPNPFETIPTSFWVITLIIGIFMLITMWMIFKKANKPGWAAIVPIYNMVVMLEVIKMDWWHILIWLFVPFAAIVYAILIPIKLAKIFGKEAGFGVFALFFPIIAYPILAFGSSTYQE